MIGMLLNDLWLLLINFMISFKAVKIKRSRHHISRHIHSSKQATLLLQTRPLVQGVVLSRDSYETIFAFVHFYLDHRPFHRLFKSRSKHFIEIKLFLLVKKGERTSSNQRTTTIVFSFIRKNTPHKMAASRGNELIMSSTMNFLRINDQQQNF